jgi:2-dehydro-3-deoxyglucarate aldolase/4-hydroxy-2-oxoheptanedioate aldolase
MKKSFRKQLAQRERLIGTLITLPSPEISEILSSAGFDWLFVDLEHSAMSVKDAQSILQAADASVACAVRVPINDEVWFKKCLDIGADGIIVPLIQTAEAAEYAVRSCKYPPEGSRSVGIGRAHGYGPDFQDYVASANEDIAVILQIEHISAVDNIESIVKVPGIDALFVGPYDLSASMGKMGQVTDPEVVDAIQKVKMCADQANIPMGIFGATVDAVQPYVESGYTLIAVNIDTMLLGGAAKQIIDKMSEL